MNKTKLRRFPLNLASARRNLDEARAHLERWSRPDAPGERAEPETEAGQCFRRVTRILNGRVAPTGPSKS